MKRRFICLANSKKYQKRCVAGIELTDSARAGYRYDIVRLPDGNPRWIRPVSTDVHGEIPALLVNHISLFDIVAVNVTRPFPQGYQSENVLFDDQDQLAVVDRIEKHKALVEKLLTPDQPWLFGNPDRALSCEAVNRLDHSLLFIKPANVRVYETPPASGHPQIRAEFVYQAVRYDLPVTDIGFSSRFYQDPHLLAGAGHIYFTISLGNEYEGRFYKLVAGILYF
jgi:hypothetical protein